MDKIYGKDAQGNIIYIGDYVFIKVTRKWGNSTLSDWLQGRILNIHGFVTFKFKNSQGKFITHRITPDFGKEENVKKCPEWCTIYEDNQLSDSILKNL